MIQQISVNMPESRPECERAVLGYMMDDAKGRDLQGMDAAIKADLFVDTKNLTLFHAIEAVRAKGQFPDIINVTTELLPSGLQEAPYMAASVLDEASPYGAFVGHVATLTDIALQRKRMAILHGLATHHTDNGEDIDRAIDNLKALKAEYSFDAGIDDCEIDLTKDYPEPRYTLTREGVGTLPRGDIQAIKAKSKNGKSFLCSILIASLLGCEDFGLKLSGEVGKVLYIDTEQNERNTARLAKRVYTLLNWDGATNHTEFHAYSLRKVDTNQRLAKVRRGIMAHHPAAVFIDGIADLIQDFNDVAQSSRVINELMRLSAEYDCATMCVLHTNKAKDDNAMKGHLGTLLLQKASDVFEVKKNGGTFSVTESDCRNLPVSGFSFMVDGHGIPYMGTPPVPQQDDKLAANMRKAFGSNAEMSYTELAKAYQLHTAKSISTAKRHISKALEDGIIEVARSNLYKMC